MPGLFDLVNADDLCSKLEHDYQRVQANGSDVYAAFDFIVTAWHLLEWKYPGKAGEAQREAVRTAHPIIELCEHLAVAGKHFAPTAAKHRSVAAMRRDSAWQRGLWAPGTWAPGVWKDDLLVDLSGPALTALGATLTFPRFAELVMDFWRGPGGCSGAAISGSAP